MDHHQQSKDKHAGTKLGLCSFFLDTMSFPAVRTDSSRRNPFHHNILWLPITCFITHSADALSNRKLMEDWKKMFELFFQPRSHKNVYFLFLMSEHSVYQHGGKGRRGGRFWISLRHYSSCLLTSFSQIWVDWIRRYAWMCHVILFIYVHILPCMGWLLTPCKYD